CADPAVAGDPRGSARVRSAPRRGHRSTPPPSPRTPSGVGVALLPLARPLGRTRPRRRGPGATTRAREPRPLRSAPKPPATHCPGRTRCWVFRSARIRGARPGRAHHGRRIGCAPGRQGAARHDCSKHPWQKPDMLRDGPFHATSWPRIFLPRTDRCARTRKRPPGRTGRRRWWSKAPTGAALTSGGHGGSWSFLVGARALGPVVGEGLLFGAPKMIGMSLDILSCLPRQLGKRFPQGVDVPPDAKERPPSAGPRGRRLSRWWVPYALIAPA